MEKDPDPAFSWVVFPRPAPFAFTFPEEIDMSPSSPTSSKAMEPDVKRASTFPPILEASNLPLVEEKSRCPPMSCNLELPEVIVHWTEPETFFAWMLPEEPLRARSPLILDALICPELTASRVFLLLTLSTAICPEELLTSSSMFSGPVIFTYRWGPL